MGLAQGCSGDWVFQSFHKAYLGGPPVITVEAGTVPRGAMLVPRMHPFSIGPILSMWFTGRCCQCCQCFPTTMLTFLLV